MKATGNFEAARDVDPMVVLSDKTRAHIDHWLAKFPPERKRSAVLQGLHAAQEQGFFDAPVGLLVTLDRRLNTGSFMDVGMFIQNVMVAARAQGLHTCAQAAFAWFHKVTRQHLPMGDNEMLLCGIALGHEDLQAPENAFITERAPLADFVSFHGMQACPDSPAR